MFPSPGSVSKSFLYWDPTGSVNEGGGLSVPIKYPQAPY